MIKFIDINKIYPHPDNPRKDLGDLTELAESIKVSGVLQNLTLVPRDEDTYTVIIGHRRLAAAKLAGLTELPCVITEMDEKEQAATMLVENMQRNDLTVYEQAQGFQMMLDLGETIDTLSEKTGFSKSTVRRRVKLLDLDKDKFQASVGRGATLMDYVKLDKIKDVELKNKVLETIGTSNFDWTLKKALDEEKSRERQKTILETVKGFATEISDRAGLKYVNGYYNSGSGELKLPEDAGKRKYYYFSNSYGVDIYRNYTAEEKRKSNEEDKKRMEQNRIQNQFSEIAKQAFDLRKEFVKGLYAKPHIEAIMQFAIKSLAYNQTYYAQIITPDEFCQYCNVPDEEKSDIFEKLSQGTGSVPSEKALLIMAYCNFHDSQRERYSDYNGSYVNNKKLDTIYEYLVRLGYEMSDEERAWCDGTHELYLSKKAE